MFEIIFENALNTAIFTAIPVDIVIKIAKASGLDKKMVPAFGMIVGIILSLFAFEFVFSWPMVLSGIFAGAIACGIYDFAKGFKK